MRSRSPIQWQEEGKGPTEGERFWNFPIEQGRALRLRPPGLTLDIGCGPYKQPGAVGVDRRWVPGVNVVCDFERGLPFGRDSVAAVYAIHLVEHLHNLVSFLEEIYRVCVPGGKVYIRTPYYASRKAFVDPTHVRFMTEESFGYFTSPN